MDISICPIGQQVKSLNETICKESILMAELSRDNRTQFDGVHSSVWLYNSIDKLDVRTDQLSAVIV